MLQLIRNRGVLCGLVACGLIFGGCKNMQDESASAQAPSDPAEASAQGEKAGATNGTDCNWLFVMTATSGSYDGKTLTLENVPPALMFTDRPKRAFGHMDVIHLVEMVSQGEDNFEKDPPNAVVSTFGNKDKPTSGLVKLLKPRIEGNKVIFPVQFLEGEIPASFAGMSLFIDPFHMHGHGHGHWHPHIGAIVATAAVVHAVSQPRTVVVTQPTHYYQVDTTSAKSPKTTEQQLTELKGLFDKGLIDKPEYDTKKSAILADM